MSVLESLLQKMLDTTGDLVVVVDDQGRYEWVNEGAARFYGMTRAELQGRDSFEFVHPDDIERARADFDRWVLRPDRATSQSDRRVVGASGELRLVAWRAHQAWRSLIGKREFDGVTLDL